MAMNGTPLCSHCLRPMAGFASLNDDPLCHPDEGIDCYHLVTVYKHEMPCTSCRENERIKALAWAALEGCICGSHVSRGLDPLVDCPVGAYQEAVSDPEFMLNLLEDK